MTEVFLHLTEQCLCPVWLRNAAVPTDRGALCGPYVTTGCLEAAHRAGASDGTLPTCVTVTRGSTPHRVTSLSAAEVYPRRFGAGPAARSGEKVSAQFRFTVDLRPARIGPKDFSCLLDSWRAPDEDSMCVCVRPSWRMSPALTGRGGAASLFSCARARRVKSCRGSLTHTLRPWALSHIRTMRLRRLGLGLGPRARRFSHSRPVLHPRLGRRLRACHGAQSGWPLHCSVRKEEVVSFLKHEDPWRYRKAAHTFGFLFH